MVWLASGSQLPLLNSPVIFWVCLEWENFVFLTKQIRKLSIGLGNYCNCSLYWWMLSECPFKSRFLCFSLFGVLRRISLCLLGHFIPLLFMKAHLNWKTTWAFYHKAEFLRKLLQGKGRESCSSICNRFWFRASLKLNWQFKSNHYFVSRMDSLWGNPVAVHSACILHMDISVYSWHEFWKCWHEVQLY